MIHVAVPQGTTEWFQARLGIPTASEFHKLLTPKTLKLSAQAEAYCNRLLAEWLLHTPFIEPETTVWSMEIGLQREEEAVQYYELTTGRETQEAGFCLTDDRQVGASPDRFVDEEGLLEIKCPLASTHVGYLLRQELPSEYVLQTQGQLFVTGRPWVDFLSYYPGLPPLLIRTPPLAQVQDALATALAEFGMLLDAGKRRLQALTETPL